MGEHVVQLARQPTALGEGRRLLAGGAGRRLLTEQLEAAGVRLVARGGVARGQQREAGAEDDLEHAAGRLRAGTTRRRRRGDHEAAGDDGRAPGGPQTEPGEP